MKVVMIKRLKSLACLSSLIGLLATNSCKSNPDVIHPPTLAELQKQCQQLRYCQWIDTDVLTGCTINQDYINARGRCRLDDSVCLESLQKIWGTNESELALTPKCQAHDPVKNINL